MVVSRLWVFICCEVGVCATFLSLFQKSPNERRVSLSVIAEPHRLCLGTRRLSNHEKKKLSLFTPVCLCKVIISIYQDSEPFHLQEGLNLFPRSAMHMHYKLSSVSLRNRVHKCTRPAVCVLCFFQFELTSKISNYH